MVLDAVGRDGPEGPQAHQQLHPEQVHPARPTPGEQVVGEVQPGRGRRHRPGPVGEHRLVALRVGQRLVHVRRQRDLPGTEPPLLGGGVVGEQAHPAATVVTQHLAHLDHRLVAARRPRAGRGGEPGAGRNPAAGANQRLPATFGPPVQQQHLDGPTGGLAEVQAGREHPTVVHHQHVTGIEQVGQVRHGAVGHRARPRHQQAGRVPGLGRVLGDGLLGQVVVEVGRVHAGRQRRGPVAPTTPPQPRGPVAPTTPPQPGAPSLPPHRHNQGPVAPPHRHNQGPSSDRSAAAQGPVRRAARPQP
jgi:hypothetical protein